MRVISNYVTPPKKVGVAGELVVTRVVTQVVTRAVEAAAVTAPAAPSIPTTHIMRAPIEGENTDVFPLLKALKDECERRPKSKVYLTNRMAIVYEEGEADLGGFALILPSGWEARFTYARPKYFLRLSKDGKIIVSNEEIVGDIVEGYLLKGLNLGNFGVTPENFLAVLNCLGLTGKLGASKVVTRGEEEIINFIAGVPAYFFTQFNPTLTDIVLRRWEEFLHDILFKGVDAFIRYAYLPTLAPFLAWRSRLAPNLLLGAPTGVGKTTLASALGVALERVTEASLTGGKFGDTVAPGIPHNYPFLIQVESLENTTLRVIGGVLGITSTGTSNVGVYGSVVRTRCPAPIYLTFNTAGQTQRSLGELLATVATGLSLNPEAMAGRFLIFASRFVNKISYKSPLLIEENAELVKEAVKAVKLHPKINGKLGKFLPPSELGKLLSSSLPADLPVPPEINAPKLLIYFETLAENAHKHINRLALCAAITEHLPDIVEGRMSPSQLKIIFNEWRDKYLKQLQIVLDDIANQLDVHLEEHIKALPHKDKFTYAVVRALQNVIVGRLGRYINAIIPVDLSEFVSEFKRTNLYSNISSQKIIEKLEKKLMEGNPVLTYISLQMNKGAKKLVFNTANLRYILDILNEH